MCLPPTGLTISAMAENTASSHPSRWITVLWSTLLVTLLILAGCASPSRSNLTPFPPMPNDRPPGASPQAQEVAKGLGRGVNFGNMLEAPIEGAWGLSVNRDLVDAVAKGGFNSVRVPVRWSNHALAERPFTLEPSFARRAENVVDALLAKGLYVVLNVHHYRHLDGEPADEGELSVSPELADERFLVLWQQIAQRFKGRSDRLLFELYNEPHGRLDAARWNDLMARALGVVRASNPNRVVVVTPVNWGNAGDLKAMKLPNDPHLIASIHNYAPFKFTHQGASWIKPALPTGVTCCDADQRAELIAPLDIAKAWSDQSGYPVYLGEFGAFNAADMASRVAYTRLMRQQALSRGISWTYWEMASHFGVYDPVQRAYRQPLLDALMGTDGPDKAEPPSP